MKNFKKHVFELFFTLIYFFIAVPFSLAAVSFLGMDASDPWEMTVESEYTAETGVQSQDGDFSVGTAEFKIKKELKLKNRLPIDVGLSVNHLIIHDETAVDLPASLQSKGINLGTKMPMPFVNSDYLFMGVNVGGYFQSAGDHAFHSSAFRVKTRLYGIYRKNERFIFALGVMASPDYEDKPVMPFAGFQYLISEQWSLHFLSNEPEVVYRLNEKTKLKLQLGILNDEFEVVSGPRKGDIVSVNEYHIGLGMEHQIKDSIAVHGTVGWAMGRKYEYLQNGGKVVPEDGIFFGFGVNASF